MRCCVEVADLAILTPLHHHQLAVSTMQKSSKTDLLVRVRYQNPLPAPPFPPKLINIPTGPQRYATYDFLSPIQGERELPLILDSELGLPLEYGKPHEGGRGDGEYWMGNRTGEVARLLPRLSGGAVEDGRSYERSC